MTTLFQIKDRIVNRLSSGSEQSLSDSVDALIASKERRSILDQLLAIGQLEKVIDHSLFSLSALEQLLDSLIPVNEFYKEMGGLVGYQQKILELLSQKDRDPSSSFLFFHPPSFIDISEMDPQTLESVEIGLKSLPEVAEMIPLGGAADRLHLVDELTKEELPAAKLIFAGKTLLQRMIEDVEAREFLYFQTYGKQIVTPIALMTSLEKKNHFHIEQMLEENRWFGRPKESFRIFIQPLVSVVNEKGDWVFSDDLKAVMKPGGHGAIWKLAIDQGVFSWFESLGRRKILVRQINNPIAGLDHGILAFLGTGFKTDKKFGFASCPRLLKSAEGVNVLIEKRTGDTRSIVLTNIEYCDFTKYGIEDLPIKEGDPYSRFSSNTNLLFVDIASIREAVNKCPFPGLLLNLKKASFVSAGGTKQEAVLGRLESTMQNIADVFEEETKGSLVPENAFITYNRRHKTISTTKRAFVVGGVLQETPEACFFDFLFAARELLEEECSYRLPPRRTLEEYLIKGPEFVFLYHPSLGPLYSTIRQKIQRGILFLGAQLRVEISDLLLHDLSLDGSLQILADRIMGQKDETGCLTYSDRLARCSLRNVTIRNQGVDWDMSRPFWQGKWIYKQSVQIILKGRSEFIAEDVVLEGPHRFEVEDGVSLTVRQTENGLSFERRLLPA